MGAIESWRNRHRNLRLEGYKRPTSKGEEFSLDSSHWTGSPNGYHRHENPFRGREIYQAQSLASDNGREPIKVHGTLEISASLG